MSFRGGRLIKKQKTNVIPGFHPVRDALINGHHGIKEIWILKGKTSARQDEILGMAKSRNIPVLFKDLEELSGLLPGVTHQGIAAVSASFSYTDLPRMVDVSLKAKEPALLIAADHITDEGNLGALIRTAAFFGSHGLIIPKDRSAKVTPGVLKRSSGAFVNLPVALVVNMGRALDLLEKKGLWIIGASGDGPESIYQFDWRRNLVLVFGNEQKGLSRTVRKRCHQLVRIPSAGGVESLNIAVAAGAVLSEICRKRESVPVPESI